MAKELIPPDEHESIKDSGVGIGQLADGKIDSFDPSEWPKLKAEWEMREAAFNGALNEVFGSEAGNEGEPDDDDYSDLDDEVVEAQTGD